MVRPNVLVLLVIILINYLENAQSRTSFVPAALLSAPLLQLTFSLHMGISGQCPVGRDPGVQEVKRKKDSLEHEVLRLQGVGHSDAVPGDLREPPEGSSEVALEVHRLVGLLEPACFLDRPRGVSQAVVGVHQ